MTSSVRLWERVYVIITFVTCCRGFDGLMYIGSGVHGRAALTDSSAARFTLLAFLYGVALAILLAQYRRELLQLIGQNKLLAALVIYILASSLWAVDPATSLRRGIAFGLTAIFCLYLAVRYPPAEILRLAAWALLLVGLASVCVVILFPEIGLEEGTRKDGWWRGVCMINTAYGRFMALGILIIWCLRRVEWRLQRYDVLVFAFFLFCTYQAHAATATAAVFTAFVSIVVIWSRMLFDVPPPAKVIVGVLVAVVMLATVPFYARDVLEVLGRDSTFTNRVFIWQAGYEQGWQHPFLGTGYGSFWIEGNASGAFYNMFGSSLTLVGNGHNGYLDAWLELGFIGVGFVVLLLGQGFIRVIRYLTLADEPFAEFYGGLLVFIVVYSIAEKVIFMHSEFTWLMFMTGLVALRWRLDPLVSSEGAAQAWDKAIPPLSQRSP